MKAETKIWTFFYGSYMNLNVLKEVGIAPDEFLVAKLNGFDIRIEPRANLIYSDQHCVYGIVATTTHDELSRLYTHAKDILGETYLPQAVLVETSENSLKPALCYIVPHMVPKPAEAAYVERILKAARQYCFPAWYIERLESFKPRIIPLYCLKFR